MRPFLLLLCAASVACSPAGSGGGGGDGGLLTDGGLTGSGFDPNLDGGCLAGTAALKLGESKMMVGASMADATASAAPFDLRYLYISGVVAPGSGPCASCSSACSTSWWGCWQDTSLAPGQYVRGFVSGAASRSQIPMITYYVLLQASGASEGPGTVSAANGVPFMSKYFADFRFLLQQVGTSKAMIHIEPDFWGYVEHTNENPKAVPAAVASANPTDCAAAENNMAGLARCLISMVRKYAPNATAGLHASGWGTKMDVLGNASSSLNVVGEANKLGTFLEALGARDGDFIALDPSDRDAAYYESQGKDTWWDTTNATLPNFTQALTWSKALSEKLQLANLWWQIPVGNMSLANGSTHWRDNRLDYFLDHTADVVKAHGFGLAFGAGATGQTTPETDNGHLIQRMKDYAAAGGQALCP
jgi:hypothetical protein